MQRFRSLYLLYYVCVVLFGVGSWGLPGVYLLQQYLDKLERRPNLKGQKSMNMAKKMPRNKKKSKKRAKKYPEFMNPRETP